MADWDADVIERNVLVFNEANGYFSFPLNSNGRDGDVIERNTVPFFEADGNSYCTCAESVPPIHTVSITPAANQITVQFTASVVLSGPAADPSNWIVTTSTHGAREVVVGSIQIAGNNVVLTTTPQTGGAAYVLILPTLGISDGDFALFTGLYSMSFTGVATIVSVQMVKTVDARTIDVIFGTPVNEADASDPANYSIDHGLEVLAAERITDFNYRLTTTRQTNDTVYTLTASNIGPL